MNCDSFRQQIDAYADGMLSPSGRAAFELHRAACADCQQALDRVELLEALLKTELPFLAAATVAEQTDLRQSVLSELGMPPDRVRTSPVASRQRPRTWMVRLTGAGLVLALALLAALTSLTGNKQPVSAADIVERAWSAVEHHQGMSDVLYWEGEWSQRFPSGDQITRTFEIWFNFDNPGRYRLTARDPDGRVFSEMVRDGVDHMWVLSRAVSDDGSERIQVDEIILSPEEMQGLGSWYVPSPFLDDLERLAEVLGTVEKVAEIEIAGRPAHVLRGQLFGFGQPGEGNRIEPVTSTVQIVVDTETYWVLGRVEWLPGGEPEEEIVAGVVQRTRHFRILPAAQVPPGTFDFHPPRGAEVHSVAGVADYYAPSSDAIGLADAATLAGFTMLLPAQIPKDLQPRPFSRYQGTGRVGTFGIVYLGLPGRQAFLLEHEQAWPLGRAARAVAVGKKPGWLVPDPIDGHRFSLYMVEPEPRFGSDGRPWPGMVELQVWGLSVEEAVAMLASLEPYRIGAPSD